MDSDSLQKQRLKEVNTIRIETYSNNTIAKEVHVPEGFQIVGKGTDAIVFRHQDDPSVVYKVFGDQTRHKLELEKRAYEILGNSTHYFPKFYSFGKSYLIISYEPGRTLYQCLEEGIEIPPHILEEVDEALHIARRKGLNPRDVHLKNIILQNGHAKLIDIADFMRPGNDQRWEHIKRGYQLFYPYIKGKRIPVFIIEYVKELYFQTRDDFDAFFAKVERLINKFR